MDMNTACVVLLHGDAAQAGRPAGPHMYEDGIIKHVTVFDNTHVLVLVCRDRHKMKGLLGLTCYFIACCKVFVCSIYTEIFQREHFHWMSTFIHTKKPKT